MRALITGASSGIGRDMARILAEEGYDLILVGRNAQRLQELKTLAPSVELITMDLTDISHCFRLAKHCEDISLDVVILNAGIGLCGSFWAIPWEREQELIDLNVRATHCLTKLFLRHLENQQQGHLLLVSSISAFFPGPKMAAYYASKAYILRLAQSVQEELRRAQSRVSLSVLCPGPTATRFTKRAKVRFAIPKADSQWVAYYALRKMFQGKELIIPGMWMKVGHLLAGVCPSALTKRVSWHMQQPTDQEMVGSENFGNG